MEKPRRASPTEVVVFHFSFSCAGNKSVRGTHRTLSQIPCFLITKELTHVLETLFKADNIATNIKM